MATFLTGKKFAGRAANPAGQPGNADALGVWDRGSCRVLTEEYTTAADHAGYSAPAGTVAVLPLGVVPAGSRLLGASITIGAASGATADKAMICSYDGDTFTKLFTIISFVAAEEGGGMVNALSQEIIDEDTELYLVPYRYAFTGDASTLKSGQYIAASVLYVSQGLSV